MTYHEAIGALEAIRLEITALWAQLEAAAGFVVEDEADFESALAAAGPDWIRRFDRANAREEIARNAAIKAFVEQAV